jgi:hypothetical protein
VPVVAERSEWISVRNREEGYTSGTTFSTVHMFGAVDASVHVSLTSFQATVLGPPGATIGISEFHSNAGHRVFASPADWEPHLNEKGLGIFVVSAHAVRADVKGSWFMQIWEDR